MTLVSVVTPTWRRHDLLLGKCIPSVRAQTYSPIEHVIVSGPDRELMERLRDFSGVVIEMPQNVEDGGATPRRIGMEAARGELIAYLDDDNTFRPDHIARLVEALQAHPEADFAYSQMIRHGLGDLIGADHPVYGGIDTSLLMHRRSLIPGTWQPPAIYKGPHTASPDWETVERWLTTGASWVHVPEVTVDYQWGLPGGSRS